jgi:hypothetical protein
MQYEQSGEIKGDRKIETVTRRWHRRVSKFQWIGGFSDR